VPVLKAAKQSLRFCQFLALNSSLQIIFNGIKTPGDYSAQRRRRDPENIVRTNSFSGHQVYLLKSSVRSVHEIAWQNAEILQLAN
jgi:hypothetical protein